MTLNPDVITFSRLTALAASSNMDGAEAGIIAEPGLSYIPHPGGLGCAIFEKIWENQAKTAQIDPSTNDKRTYRALFQNAIRAAIEMRSRGVTSNDDITLLCQDSIDAYVAYFATLFLAAKPSIINPKLPRQQLASILTSVKPKIIFIDTGCLGIIEQLLPEASFSTEIILLDKKSSKYSSFDEFLKPQVEEEEFRPTPVSDLTKTALLVLTTSENPKIVCLSHQGILTGVHNLGSCLPFHKTLVLDSFSSINSIQLTIATIFYGALKIVTPKCNFGSLWNCLINIKPTLALMTRSAAEQLIESQPPQLTERLSLKLVILTSDCIPLQLLSEIQKTLPTTKITLGYTQTETGGLVSFFKPNRPEEITLLEKKPLSSGKLMPGYSIKITKVNSDTETPLQPNQKGEIRISGNYLMNNYLMPGSIKSKPYDCEWWLKTGDLGYYDDDNCIFVSGRLRDSLQFQDCLAVPSDFETVLLEHPAITRAAVVLDKSGQSFTGLVVSCDANVTEEDVLRFAYTKLENAKKLLGQVKFVNKIPLTCMERIKRLE